MFSKRSDKQSCRALFLTQDLAQPHRQAKVTPIECRQSDRHVRQRYRVVHQLRAPPSAPWRSRLNNHAPTSLQQTRQECDWPHATPTFASVGRGPFERLLERVRRRNRHPRLHAELGVSVPAHLTLPINTTISERRSHPRQRLMIPGSGSDFLFRKPPSFAIQMNISRMVGTFSGTDIFFKSFDATAAICIFWDMLITDSDSW